jgi:hypothetical protein
MLFLFLLILAADACPYYIMNMGRHNFTTAFDAYDYAVLTGAIAHVCYGTVTPADELLPVIVDAVHFVGDPSPTNPRCLWIIEVQTPAFVISSGGNAIFENFLFEFDNTVFSVSGQATLNVMRSQFWYGTLGVLVNSPTGFGYGFFGDHLLFSATGVGIKKILGDVQCSDCRFANMRIAGIATTALTLDGLTTPDPVWVNTLYPFAFQSGSSATAAVSQILETDTVVLTNGDISCRTWPDSSYLSQINTTSGSVGVGSGTKSCPACSSSTADFIVRVFFDVLLLLLIFVVIIVYGKLKRVKSSTVN